MVPPAISSNSPGRAPPSRLHQTAADSIVAALTPGLIIGMICCLVFFLIVITCRGEFTVRLMYILGLYTFASVLVARIAIEQSRTVSMGYTSVLGVATLLVVLQFVQFSGIFAIVAFPLTIGFLVLIGFLADRITFDCTLIDDSEDSSGVGLLQSLGVIRNPQTLNDAALPKPASNESSTSSPSPKKKAKQRKQRHNPGVWVLYFAILAIPLFGLGQMTIPASETGSRAAAYWFLFGYLFFSLGLLVSTSFLGLRRYLRQRQLEMPVSLSAIWIGAGIVGVFAVLLAVSLLPLPSGSLGFLDLPIRIETATNLQPSRFGSGEEGTERDAENAAKTTKPKAKAKATDESKRSNEAKSDKKSESKDGSAKTEGKSKDSDKSDEKANSPQKSPSPDSDSKSKENAPQQPKKPPAEDRAEQKKQENSKRDASAKSQSAQAKPETPKSSWSISMPGGLSNLLRWFVSLLLILLIVFLVLRYRDQLALMLKDLAAWWRGLFGIQEENSQPDAAATPLPTSMVVPLKPFSDFPNPFATKGAGWNAAKIIRHTFEALEAWGRERQMTRSEQETPEVYLRRLAAKYPEQSESIQRLMQLYNRLAYANASGDATEVKRLSHLWSWLKA